MDKSNVLRDRLAAICVAARCSECVSECEVAAAKDAADAVLIVDKSLAAKMIRLCALVIEMEGKAAPPDEHASHLIVSPDNLGAAARLAYEIRPYLPRSEKHTRRDMNLVQFPVNCE